MWSVKYPINIIISKNSWYEIYANRLLDSLNSIGFTCTILFSHEDVKANSIALYLSYPSIVPPKFITIAYRSLVAHASDLPSGAGFSPWVWQILEGKNRIPVCLFAMEETLDSGPIFVKDSFSLKGTELLPEIRELLALKIQQMIIAYLSQADEPKSMVQQGEKTIYRKRGKTDSMLDIKKSIEEQFNLLRVVDNDNYPAYFKHLDKKYILRIYEENE